VRLDLKRRGLTTRLTIAFASVAIATALIAAVVLTVSWNHQFELYVQKGVQETAERVAAAVAIEYENAGGWDRVGTMDLTHFGVADNAEIQVVDADGTLVMSTTGHGDHVTLGGTPPDLDETAASAEVVAGGTVIGEVRVTQTVAAGFMTERDLWFQASSLRGLALATVIAVVLASLCGVLFSRGIVRPINAVTRAAEALRRGDRSARTGMTGGDPIADLGATFDEMAEAVQAERAFEQQLTADVAHELRTPLQAIQATVEAMQDGVLPTDEERLGLIHNETVRLGRLAGSILDLSRLETGSAHFAPIALDVALPVEAALGSSRALMESTGHSLEESLEHGLMVLGDPDRLTQAVGNLLSNAARYTPEGGRVRLTLHAEGQDAVIEVADSGIGVAEEDRERVFTRFWRADPARTRASGGLGIGLAVVREIVERHGGMVSVGSSDLGGASFVMRIPRAKTDRP